MKLTPWYPHTIKPVRAGIYETIFRLRGNFGEGYSYWNGKRWSNCYVTKELAFSNRKMFKQFAIQEKEWRGLTKKERAA